MRALLLALTAALPLGLPAVVRSSADEIAERLIEGVDLGPSRGICIGTEVECRAKGEQSARTGIDLLVTFDLDSAELTPAARLKLGETANALQEEALKGRRFALEGFTDARGTEIHNLGLSERRANAVRDFLVGQGVEASRLTAVGKGASNFRTADRLDPINRRVELRLSAP